MQRLDRGKKSLASSSGSCRIRLDILQGLLQQGATPTRTTKYQAAKGINQCGN
jgi:hypothetical protein